MKRLLCKLGFHKWTIIGHTGVLNCLMPIYECQRCGDGRFTTAAGAGATYEGKPSKEVMAVMKKLATMAAVLVAAFLSGCSSVNYGPFSVKSLGTDVSFDSAAWVKTTTNGNEGLTIVGAKRNATDSVHTVGNVAMAAIGALIGGSVSGGAGAGIGAAGGLSAADIYQTLKDWINKTTPPVAPVAPVTPVVTPVVPPTAPGQPTNITM